MRTRKEARSGTNKCTTHSSWWTMVMVSKRCQQQCSFTNIQPLPYPDQTPCAANQRPETLLNYTTASQHTPTHLNHYKVQHTP